MEHRRSRSVCPGRIIDLSGSAAKQLDLVAAGIAEIRIEVIGQKGLDRKISVWKVRSKKRGVAS